MYTGLHPLGSVDDHVQLCEDAEVDILIVHPKFAEIGAQIVARATSVKHLLTLGPADVGEDLLALCAQVGPETLTRGDAEEEDIAWLQYTGGTTGRPKAAMISHRAMVQQVFSLIASWRLPLDPRTLHRDPDHPRRCPARPSHAAARRHRRSAGGLQRRAVACGGANPSHQLRVHDPHRAVRVARSRWSGPVRPELVGDRRLRCVADVARRASTRHKRRSARSCCRGTARRSASAWPPVCCPPNTIRRTGPPAVARSPGRSSRSSTRTGRRCRTERSAKSACGHVR